MSDLFGTPAILWDEASSNWEGTARDGRPVRLELSPLTGRIIAVIALRDGAITRRSCKTGSEARAIAAQIIEETSA